MLSDKFGENQERRVCWRNSPFPCPPFSGLFSALGNSFLGAVSPRLPCLSLVLGSANERRERSDICPWFLLLCCSFTVASFFWHQLCILVWVKKYIEEKKRVKENMYWWILRDILYSLRQTNTAMSDHPGFEDPLIQSICWDLPVLGLYPFPHLSHYSSAYCDLWTRQHLA